MIFVSSYIILQLPRDATKMSPYGHARNELDTSKFPFVRLKCSDVILILLWSCQGEFQETAIGGSTITLLG